jgi:hypothetical protein
MGNAVRRGVSWRWRSMWSLQEVRGRWDWKTTGSLQGAAAIWCWWEAETLAEAVAQRPGRRTVVKRGRVVAREGVTVI